VTSRPDSRPDSRPWPRPETVSDLEGLEGLEGLEAREHRPAFRRFTRDDAREPGSPPVETARERQAPVAAR
jgi:hypothetical protein